MTIEAGDALQSVLTSFELVDDRWRLTPVTLRALAARRDQCRGRLIALDARATRVH
jgi:hypothetical protein